MIFEFFFYFYPKLNAKLFWKSIEIVYYKNEIVGEYIPDIIINDSVIVELKCVEYLTDIYENQLLNYLKATDCEVGLILNFGKDPQFIRKIFTNDLKKKKR